MEKKPIPLYIRLFPGRFLPFWRSGDAYFFAICKTLGQIMRGIDILSTNPQDVDNFACGRSISPKSGDFSWEIAIIHGFSTDDDAKTWGCMGMHRETPHPTYLRSANLPSRGRAIGPEPFFCSVPCFYTINMIP